MATTNTPSLSGAIKSFFELFILDRSDITAIYFFTFLGGLIQLSLPLGIQSIIGFVQAGSISVSIIVLITVVIIGVFFYGLVQIKQMQVIEKVEQKIFVRYSFAFADKIPHLDLEQQDNYHLPELMNRYFETSSLTKDIEKMLLDIPAAIIQILFGIILLSFYHPVFIAFGLLLLLLLSIIIRYTSKKGFVTSLDASNSKYEIASWLQEVARAVKSFKFLKKEPLHIIKMNELVSGFLKARTAHFKVLLMQYWTLITFKIVITAAMLIVGTILLLNQQINIGQFIASDIVILTIMGSVEKLIGSLDKVYNTLTSIQKLKKVMESNVENDGNTILINTIEEGIAIKINNLSYSYPDGKKVLQHITANIAPGSLVGVTGERGTGKTTFLKLLTAAYKGYQGNILVNDIPMGNYNLNSLRSQTGVLLNDDEIFQGTLLENITMGSTSVTLSQVIRIVQLVGLQDFVNEQQLGFDRKLYPKGKQLSAHIKHNILLARALVGMPRLLLLKEPFKYLDVEQTTALIQYLKHEKSTTTIISFQDARLKPHFDQIITL